MSSTSSSSTPPARTRAIRTPYHKWRGHHVTWMIDGHTRLQNWDAVTQHMNNEARKIGEAQSFNTPMVKAYWRFLRKKEEKEMEEAAMKEDYGEEHEDEVSYGGDVEVEKFVKEAVEGMGGRESAGGIREGGRLKRAKFTQKKSGGERADIMQLKSVLESVEPKEPELGYVECVEYEDGMEWREGLTWNGALVSKEAFDGAQGLLKMSKDTM